MELEKKLIVAKANTYTRKGCDCSYCAAGPLNIFKKNSEKSIYSRKEGNKRFIKKEHDSKIHEEIWRFYTLSIATALNKLELAAGYANRSALFLHLRKYKESLQDIDRALKATTSNVLKVKLFCRKTECLVALQEGKQRSSFEKAKFWLNKIEDNENKKSLHEMMKKVENILDKNILDYYKKEKENEIICTNDAVSISYTQKYGRYLTAARDIKIGEFVCMEKFYVTSVNGKILYAYCSHCLGVSWTIIPCNNCAFYMFCSEKCKKEAWEKYHDIECKTHIGAHSYLNYFTQLSVRSLIKGIKETGNIKNLKNLINTIEKCSDERTKGFSKNGEFSSDSFASLYSLSYPKFSDEMDFFVKNSLCALNILAEKTNIFGEDFIYSNSKNLIKHDDALFIGTLLLRLTLIISVNAFNVINPNFDCKKKQHPIICSLDLCCTRGLSLSLFTSLINHNCDNNVGKFYTNDGKVVYFALKPIEKGSQIFSAYYYNYMRMSKQSRQVLHRSMFHFNCDCIACQKNWPHFETFYMKKANMNMPSKDLTLCQMLMHKHEELIVSKNAKRRCNKKNIHVLGKDLETLLKVIKQPSFFIESLLLTYHVLFEEYYGSRLKMTNECKN